jgi:D-alanyl-D-alanine carboxypeptidase
MWASTRENGYYGFFQWIYPAPLAGCGKAVRIVERQGLVGGIELRNYLLPETGRGLILFSRKRPTDLGDPWEGKGFAFDLLSSAVCRKDSN